MFQALALTVEEQAIYTQHHKDCVETSGVEREILEKAYEGEVIEDINLKQYFTCFFVKSGFQNENGEMQPAVINSVLPHMTRNADETARTIIECEGRKLVGKDPADTAFLNFKCYIGAVWEATLTKTNINGVQRDLTGWCN